MAQQKKTSIDKKFDNTAVEGEKNLKMKCKLSENAAPVSRQLKTIKILDKNVVTRSRL